MTPAEAVKTYSYDGANELETSKDDYGTTTYTYDATGNQVTAKTSVGAVTTNVWDDESQRMVVVQPNGDRCTTTYNGDGQRVENQHDTIPATKFIWNAGRLLAETNSADVTQALYTLAPGAGLISRLKTAANYFQFDGFGSTANLTDIVEWILQIIKYDPCGNIIYDQPNGSSSSSSTSLTESPFMWLARTGLLYLWDLAESLNLRRIYDSIKGQDLNPQSGGSDSALYYYPGWTVLVTVPVGGGYFNVEDEKKKIPCAERTDWKPEMCDEKPPCPCLSTQWRNKKITDSTAAANRTFITESFEYYMEMLPNLPLVMPKGADFVTSKGRKTKRGKDLKLNASFSKKCKVGVYVSAACGGPKGIFGGVTNSSQAWLGALGLKAGSDKTFIICMNSKLKDACEFREKLIHEFTVAL